MLKTRPGRFPSDQAAGGRKSPFRGLHKTRRHDVRTAESGPALCYARADTDENKPRATSRAGCVAPGSKLAYDVHGDVASYCGVHPPRCFTQRRGFSSRCRVFGPCLMSYIRPCIIGRCGRCAMATSSWLCPRQHESLVISALRARHQFSQLVAACATAASPLSHVMTQRERCKQQQPRDARVERCVDGETDRDWVGRDLWVPGTRPLRKPCVWDGQASCQRQSWVVYVPESHGGQRVSRRDLNSLQVWQSFCRGCKPANAHSGWLIPRIKLLAPQYSAYQPVQRNGLP